MREILFRGRSLETGEWVEGSLVHETEYYGDPVDRWHIVDIGAFHFDYYWSTTVDPNYIHQYTGLNYKDGRKIFEGDLVKAFNDYAEIRYSKDRFVLDFGNDLIGDLSVALDYIEHFGIACEPPKEFDKEWSKENEHLN